MWASFVIVLFVLLFYGLGCAVAYGIAEENRHPARERAGRAALWPLFALVAIYSAVTTGFVTLTRAKEKAAAAAEDFEDEQDD